MRLLALVSLCASAAYGAGAPLCYPIVPGDRLLVPANVPVFVGPNYATDTGTLTLTGAGTDGGVRELDRLDGGERYYFSFFSPGAIAKGQRLVLESNLGTCTAPAPARSEVTVIDAAPFPTELGPVSFGEPVGLLLDSRAGLTGQQPGPAVRRDVLVTFPDEVHPWLSMLRVRVDGANSLYGHLARNVTAGTPTVVGSVVMECRQSHDKFSKTFEVALEIPGHPSVVRTEVTTELDCSKAPPPPGGCSSVPVLSLGVLALWLRRRRSGLQQRREDEAIE